MAPSSSPGPSSSRLGILARLRVAIVRRMFEGSGRDRRQQPDKIVALLRLAPGSHVADLGAGTGYFTFRLARAVGPSGVVYAVDTEQTRLVDLARRAADWPSIVTIRPEPTQVQLPELVDLVFLAHAYHHLPDRTGYFGQLRTSLRDGGRVAIVEGRPTGFVRRLFGHVTEPEVIVAEMAAAGYELLERPDVAASDSFQIFGPIRAGSATAGPGGPRR